MVSLEILILYIEFHNLFLMVKIVFSVQKRLDRKQIQTGNTVLEI